MTDTTTTTDASQGWSATLASIKKWPQVAALAIAAALALAYFDKLPSFGASADATIKTMIDGHSVTITALESRVKDIEDTAAAKADIAEIMARLTALEKPKAAPVTTGSIAKKK